MKFSATLNGKIVQMFVGRDCKEADEVDWALMIAARSLAVVNKLFDPSMIAATTGKLVHARACEMETDTSMIIDVSDGKLVTGPGVHNEEDISLVIPNHTHITIARIFDGYVVTLCKGRDVSKVLEGKGTFQLGEPDPSYVG